MKESIPSPDASFDLVFADNLLEHPPNPEQVFAEVARVLRPGSRNPVQGKPTFS